MAKPIHRYENLLMDSARWSRYSPRADDIIISTPYKAGTTWTQRICSLLIYKERGLEVEINQLSPWLDAKFASIDSVLAAYDAQTERRFFKTHTPLSGLPYYSEVSYVVVGRDPRDIFMSMQHHYANMDPERAAELLDVSVQEFGAGPALPDDLNERFKLWLTKGSFPWEQDGFPLWSVFYHLQSFWDIRSRGNVYFMHYQDMLDDLSAEMAGLAAFLNIEIPEASWPVLIETATFESMKNDAARNAPNAHKDLWRESREFFHRGTSGQWRGQLSEENLQLYEQVKNQRLDSALAAWLDNRS